MNHLWLRHSALLLLVVFTASASAQKRTPKTEAKTLLVVTVSVDWEGRDLTERNLKAFENFREKFPKVPLTHFLNAAYYTRSKDADKQTKLIRRTIRDGDEIGLHIHCWRTLVEKSGVKYRALPTFWSAKRPARKGANGDEGHEVELAAYEAEEVEKLARTSTKILKENGFEVSKSFRAAGWVASKDVLLGVRKAGFEVDSSATDRKWHEEEIAKYAIYERIGEVWPKVTKQTQPYVIKTEAGDLLEMPDTGALADYVNAEEMDIHLKEAFDQAKKDGKVRFVHIGFHQETASRYVKRVADCLAKWQDVEGVEFLTLENAAKKASSKPKLP